MACAFRVTCSDSLQHRQAASLSTSFSLAEKQLLSPLTLDLLTMFCIILYIHTLCQSYSQEKKQQNKKKLFFNVKLVPHSFNQRPLISLLETVVISLSSKLLSYLFRSIAYSDLFSHRHFPILISLCLQW